MWNLFPIDLGQLILIFNGGDAGNDADDGNDDDDGRLRPILDGILQHDVAIGLCEGHRDARFIQIE